MPMNSKRKLVLAAPNVLFLALITALNASEGGSLLGTITDPAGAAVPGATVMATEHATAVKHPCISDSRGVYSFQNLPGRRYNLDVQPSGFQPLRRTGVEVNVDSKV